MAAIKQILSKEILNGKGTPTIETTVILDDNSFGVASIPIGTTIGTYEAAPLYDNEGSRFLGKGVLKAVNNVITVIAPKLVGMQATEQAQIDRIMIDLDGTANKEVIGANAILSVSIAVAKAAARSSGMQLYAYLKQFTSRKDSPIKIPTPIFSIINGGLFNSSKINFQEFFILPAVSTKYDRALEMAVQVYQRMKEVLKLENYPIQITDEGGYCPPLPHNMEAFFLMSKAIEKALLRMGFDIYLGINAAATSFYKSQEYTISDKDDGKSSKALISYYEDLVKQFHLLYFEDALAEDDWDGWTQLTEKLSQQAVIMSGDLTATNPYRLSMAVNKKAATGVSIMPTQIGTVIESLAFAEVALTSNLKVAVSSRTGETLDDFVADFAVAINADYIKCGAPARGEHIAKYNRLSEIYAQTQAH